MAQGKRRVLLVDDEPAIVKTVGKRLEVAGYEVLIAMDGEDALTKARLGQPDVIILDLMLPKRSGYDVCSTLKNDPTYRAIPIIIFTGKGQEMDETLCRELGANAYISKPRQAKALIEQIEALLGHVLPEPPAT
ncbi:MAG: response regulator [Candidatus Omnitrophica bacterium]|nr:response regulator [Candidatus Omnitrophota bacterium]